jgi:tRNA-dihydrouridine synthase 3
VEAPSTPSPFAGKLWLAPLTKGGHLPFRRLCAFFGADVTVGEMAVVYHLLKGRSGEFALLRSHPEEPCFGAQLADRNADSLAEGARMAESRGARFVDLNCGCPIDAITRRGLGASLLRKPTKLARLVEAMRKAVSIPVTVKLRSGWKLGDENVTEVAKACEEAGAAAITVHGRTREQRYSRAADWDLIGRVGAERGIPVVGNGDILTHYEARARQARSGVSSLMIGRGALIKPWVFREIKEGRDILPSAEERLDLSLRLVALMREHFGADERGRARILSFLPWHLELFARYRPLPEAEWTERALQGPLIHARHGLGEALPPLETLLRDPRSATHEALARLLVSAGSLPEAIEQALALQASLPPPGEEVVSEVSPREVAG